MTKSRGLNSVKRKIGNITPIIDQLIKESGKIKVLELGVGYGNAIMGLSKKYGKSKIILYGMNKKKEHGIEKRKDFIKRALNYKVIKRGDVKKIVVPYIIIGDAGQRIPLKSNSIDFIYSITTFFFIPNKAHAIEEIYRVLKPEGKARIHFKHYVPRFPKGFKNLFVIQDGKKRIDVRNYLSKYKDYGISLKPAVKGTEVLIINKPKGQNSLNLNLKLIKNKTQSLRDRANDYFATKSVFEVKR